MTSLEEERENERREKRNRCLESPARERYSKRDSLSIGALVSIRRALCRSTSAAIEHRLAPARGDTTFRTILTRGA
ncbi:hypothetical protein RR46_01849 [Papilio xuthus]|uniref:Uncharacterized protein n=1 Tax=Papilio xuthus TaxID=66420 RepID=A0A194QEJ0_PAPXU|nr:hypothetical protein RR46_01849 [Papilio xuthus]